MMGGFPFRGFESLHLPSIRFYEQRLELKAKALLPNHFAETQVGNGTVFTVDVGEMDETGNLLEKYNKL